jgi:hypothetical protein
MASEEKKTEAGAPVDKKAKMKKKANKLFAKMKAKGKSLLEEKKMPTTAVEPEREEAREHCAFCQEQLDPSNYLNEPYGNFAHIQQTNLVYHAMQQTSKSQRRALRNADLAKVTGKAGDEEVDSDGDSLMAGETAAYKLQPIAFLKEVQGEAASFVNRFTGSGAHLKTCRHHAHYSCLQKYAEQQLTGEEGQFQARVAGFLKGEFACPICKCLCSTLMPALGLDKIVPHAAAELDESRVALLGNYADFFSTLMLKQQGLVYVADKDPDYVKKLQRDLMLRDFKETPYRCLKEVSRYLLHELALIDLHGLPAFLNGDVGRFATIISSLVTLVQVAQLAKHPALDNVVGV